MPQSYFDYQQVVEEKEELDFNNLVNCPKCKKPIPYNSTMCLYCGREVYFSKKAPWIIWVAVLLLIAFLVVMVL